MLTTIALSLLFMGSAIVLWGLLSPVQNLPVWSHRHDKLLHILAFAVLAILACLSWPDISRQKIWVLLTGLGLASECLQQLTPSRRFCWIDSAANAAGAALGILLVTIATFIIN
jgi:VanZ family protein